MAKEISLIIADDHPVFLRGLRMIIETEPGLRVLGEANNGEVAFSLIQAHKPQVAVLDVEMPGLDGFALMRALREREAEVAVIFLTAHEDEAVFNAALNLGVAGYILKESAITDIVAGIKTVAAGRNFVTPRLATYLLNRRSDNKNAGGAGGLEQLTPSEMRVLSLIASHKTSKEIAEELFISPHTVSRHRANICAKLNLNGINALLKYAIENKPKLP